MKVALAVNQICEDINSNLKTIKKMIGEATDHNCDLILFPEAAITGLINNDNPEHDLSLGELISGDITNQLCEIAIKNSINIVIGMLEREEKKLYDTAIFITSDGKISLKYRRISSGWHGEKADPNIYCQGHTIQILETKFGKFAILICGDLFDEKIIKKVKILKPNYILFLMARNFEDNSYDQERWDKEEKNEYVKQMKKIGAATFMVNYFDNGSLNDFSFGGAMAVSKAGNIISELPLGREGILFVEL